MSSIFIEVREKIGINSVPHKKSAILEWCQQSVYILTQRVHQLENLLDIGGGLEERLETMERSYE